MRERLDRATYFEMKVKGFDDERIRNRFEISKRRMTELRSEWGFTGIRTEGFQWLMKKAKKGQEYVTKQAKGAGRND